jgi:hypothetical protein
MIAVVASRGPESYVNDQAADTVKTDRAQDETMAGQRADPDNSFLAIIEARH